MSRLPLLAAAVLVLALPRAARAVTAEELVAGAKAQIDAGCLCSKDACPKLKELFAGYLLVARSAEACVAKKCPAGTVLGFFTSIEKLDKEEGALPDPARAEVTGERPFLRLSLLASYRATQALALADPAAKPPLRFDPDVDAPRAVELVCINAGGSACESARNALADAKAVREKADACEKKPCPFPELDQAAERSESGLRAFFQASRSGVDTLALFGLLNNDRQRLALIVARDANARLASLDAGLGALEGGVASFAKGGRGDAVSLEAQVGRLTETYREASLGADRSAMFMLDDRKSGVPRERLNAAAARLSAARAKLVAAETAGGLSPFSAAADAVAGALGKPAAGPKTVAAAAPSPLGPTLLDRRTIPSPPPSSPKAPPILDRKPSLMETARDIWSDDPMKKADARHRSGLSYTVGDPAGRAKLVHGQTFPDTCAVVSQQEVLTALKLLPADDPVGTEKALREEALKRGFYRDGTPDAYTAELLIDRGVLVTKHPGSTLKDLDAAVRRGGMVIANVDARPLWGIAAPKVLGHAIVIVGAEVDRFSGETLGYYVNDSGSDPPGHGRFVPAAKFEKAWSANTRSYAEVR